MNFASLFPTTIASTILTTLDIDAALTHIKQLEYVDDHGTRGQFTKDQAILADPFFALVLQEIEDACTEFAIAHGHIVEGIGVCSSWANKVPAGHSINKHTHANSYISGCFYLTGGSPIEFFNSGINDNIFNFAPAKQFNPDNSLTYGSVFFDIAPGQLVLFPSGLVHGVREHIGNDRYSISFNTLPTGLFGEPTKQMRWNKVKVS